MLEEDDKLQTMDLEEYICSYFLYLCFFPVAIKLCHKLIIFLVEQKF